MPSDIWLKKFPPQWKTAHKNPAEFAACNSVLSEVRKGGVDYAYSLEQIRDIMRFEPDISVKYIADAGAYGSNSHSRVQP